MSTLSTKQVALITELLAGADVKQASARAGVPYATARRWLRLPAVQAELAAARREAIQRALDALTAAARAAGAMMVRTMADQDAPPAVRLRAADLILSRLIAWIELEDIDARLKALEDRYAAETR